MTMFGSVEFTIEELPGELRIRYGRHAGWIDWILASAVPVLVTIGWFLQEPVLIAVGGGLSVLVFALWGRNYGNALRVFPDRLVYSNFARDPREILLADVASIRWRTWSGWDENTPSDGLYISYSGRLECLLPLGSERARAVISAIYRKFPQWPVDVPAGAAWFDELPDITDFKTPGDTDMGPDKSG